MALNMDTTPTEFIKNIVDGINWDTSQHKVQTARLNLYTEPSNWCGGNLVRDLKCTSEVNLVVSSGEVQYCYVYGMTFDVSSGQLEGVTDFGINNVFTDVFLDVDIIEGYSADIYSGDADTSELVFSVFGKNADNSYVDRKDIYNRELQLRNAVNAKMNKVIKGYIKNNNIDNPFMVSLTNIAKSAIQESVTALNSMLNEWKKPLGDTPQ